MKIGIITYHAAHNYGAMLQAYALQKILQLECGHNAEIINYRPTLGDDSERILPRISFPPRLKALFRYLIKLRYYNVLKQKHDSFELFLEKHLIKTDIYQTFDELKQYAYDFDVYITGSDQTFSPKSRYLDAFYLAFCPLHCKKLAYAPSFGFNYIPEDKVEKITALLKDYKYLSAREAEGCKLIESLIGIEVPSVLDPVFLLKSDIWRTIANSVELKHKKYILCYALIGTEKQMQLASKIKKLTGLPIVMLTHTVYPRTNADVTINFAGPQEFIWLFDNASYIVTDSFHGTAFSIIFEKPFNPLIVFKEKAGRITNLLAKLSLENRLFDENTEMSQDMMALDYKVSRVIIEQERAKSINYLKTAINE